MGLTDAQMAALAAGAWTTNEDDADLQFDDISLRDDAATEIEFGRTHGGGPSLVGITTALAKEVQSLRKAIRTYGNHLSFCDACWESGDPCDCGYDDIEIDAKSDTKA
jgi:hypothetical protein